MSNQSPTYTPPDTVRKLAEELVATWPPITAAQSAVIGSIIGGGK